MTTNTVTVKGSCGHFYDSSDTRHIVRMRIQESRGQVTLPLYSCDACPECRKRQLPVTVESSFDDFEGANW